MGKIPVCDFSTAILFRPIKACSFKVQVKRPISPSRSQTLPSWRDTGRCTPLPDSGEVGQMSDMHLGKSCLDSPPPTPAKWSFGMSHHGLCSPRMMKTCNSRSALKRAPYFGGHVKRDEAGDGMSIGRCEIGRTSQYSYENQRNTSDKG